MERYEIDESALDADGIPKKINGKISAAWFTGVVAILFTVIMIVYSFFQSGPQFIGIHNLIDIAIMGCFVFGTYKKSRVCAILLLSYHLLNTVFLVLFVGDAGNIPMVLLFTLMYILGVVGTFQYHSFKKNSHNNPVNLMATS